LSIGDVLTLTVLAICVGIALLPSRRSHSSPTSVRLWLSYLVNELPFLAGGWLLTVVAIAAVDDELATPTGVVGSMIALLAAFGLVVIVRRALRARATLELAHLTAFGTPPAPPSRRWTRWPRILLWPFPWLLRPGLRRTRNLAYGPSTVHRLDVYQPRRRPAGGPILIHFHGGAFRGGRKNLDAQPLVNRLVPLGWVCVSANYRLSPDAVFPDQLVDVKHVIAWVRANARDFGADPGQIVVAGSSAGGHLAATAALTPNDPRFQPHFEDLDTTVRAAICFYPYPGAIETRGPASSPLDYLTPDAPPMFIASGTHDTLVIPSDSRHFAASVRAASHYPVVSAELPGAQHCFDLFHSVRFESVVDAVQAFADVVLDRRGADRPA
jgi:acetyl esterase/lipase